MQSMVLPSNAFDQLFREVHTHMIPQASDTADEFTFWGTRIRRHHDRPLSLDGMRPGEMMYFTEED